MDVEPVCKVPLGQLDAGPPCGGGDPTADGLELVEKWQYAPTVWHSADDVRLVGMPLVATLNDENADGAVDLCDVPAVVVQEVHFDLSRPEAVDRVVLQVLSGNDGQIIDTLDTADFSLSVPAIADLDSDGVPEIVAATRGGRLVALRPGGEMLWESAVEVFDPVGWYTLDPPMENYLRAIYVANSAVAVHDLDADGSPEILFGMTVLDAAGNLVFADPTQGAEFGDIVAGRGTVRPTVADLDGDGHLEVLFGHVTYSASGEELWRVPGLAPGAHAHVADFTGDGGLEILFTSEAGLTLVDAAGTIVWGPTRMGFDDPPLHWCWAHAAAVADVDGDGRPEALVNTCEYRMALRIDAAGPAILRSLPVPVTTTFGSLLNSSTAFDFLGAGADWVAYHQNEMRVLRGISDPALSVIGTSFNHSDVYPIVADIDNDGSADVLAVRKWRDRLIAFEDSGKRPSPARRIWNQWGYGATFVREDATIPPMVTRGSFRAQERIGCVPRPEVPE